MNKSQRIYLNTGTTQNDKYIQFQLEQDVDTIEFMTMNIYTKDAYQDFNSDYGVLVGRVIANGGIGIPNAKISIFIPLTDADADIGDIASIYPYKTPRDKNSEGKRYNLLPRVSEFEPSTGVFKPKQPFGSFPIKPEIVTNQAFLDVYKKYYKYTALTNNAGDYMIFGVPIGVQTVHLSVDITDIGKFSMTPAAMVTNLGYSPNFFTDNNTRIKPSEDLTDLPNIETQEITVDIVPFWGDTTNFTIGITRQDFRIRSVLTNTFTIFGSVFTDAYKSMWGRGISGTDSTWALYQMGVDNGLTVRQNIGAAQKAAGTVTEKIYYYPVNISDTQIATGKFVDQMLLLDTTQYSVYKRGGDFAAIVSCNRRKIITDDFGNEVVVADNAPDGIFTRFSGFMTLEISPDTIPLDWESIGHHVEMKPIRQIIKIPQYADAGKTFVNPNTYHDCCNSSFHGNDTDIAQNNAWRAEHYSFSGGGLYSVSRFHGIVANGLDRESSCPYGFIAGDTINVACIAWSQNAGVIQTNNYDSGNNDDVEFPTNSIMTGCAAISGLTCATVFGANWMNLSIYLPQTGWVYNNYAYIHCWRVNSQFTFADRNKYNNSYYQLPNKQLIAGKYTDTCSFTRSDLNWSDFIPMTKCDVVKMNETGTKGFKTFNDGKTITTISGNYPLQGTYRNGTYKPSCNPTPAPFCGGKCNGVSTCASDGKTYFFKGIDTSDCVAFITCLGII
jgi:hypothetical protein